MSINFHAYQSRGYLFENFEVQCEQWRTLFSEFNPERVSKILHLNYDTEYLYLTYFGELYRLCLDNGILEKETQDDWTSQLYFNETMSIYHLLHYVKDIPILSGTWVLNEHLDERRKSGKVNDILLDSFAVKFSDKSEILKVCCEKMHGIAIHKGDVGYEFEVYPEVKLRMIFWDQDEDFPAQVQIFVDSRITDYVHIETTGCMISDLLERIEKVSESI